MVRFALFVPVMLAAWHPAVASAPQALLDCGLAEASQSLKDEAAASAMKGGDDPEAPRIKAALTEIAETCANRYALPTDQREIYGRYTMVRILHEAYGRKLAAGGLDPGIVDQTLGFGAGGENPLFEANIPDATVSRVIERYSASGVDIAKIPDALWEQLGGYILATSLMWNSIPGKGQ